MPVYVRGPRKSPSSALPPWLLFLPATLLLLFLLFLLTPLARLLENRVDRDRRPQDQHFRPRIAGVRRRDLHAVGPGRAEQLLRQAAPLAGDRAHLRPLLRFHKGVFRFE